MAYLDLLSGLSGKTQKGSDPKLNPSGVAVPDQKVFENYLGLAEEELAANMQPRPWVTRPFDATKYGIDALSLFVAKLAAPTADNPLLIKQNGAQYLGTEKISGVETSKFKNGSLTYFVTDKGELVKVTAPVKGFKNEISVVFSERGNTTVEVPPEADTYPIEEVSSFYSTARPAF